MEIKTKDYFLLLKKPEINALRKHKDFPLDIRL